MDDPSGASDKTDQPASRALHVQLTISSVLMCVMSAGAFVIGAVVACLIIPRVAHVFADFGVKLPIATAFLFRCPPALLVGSALLIALLLVTKEILIRNRYVTLLINAVALLLAGAWVLTIILAMFLPMTTLITDLSNP